MQENHISNPATPDAIKGFGVSCVRVDRSNLPRVDRTEEGYLKGDAIVTRTGVFKYLNADGTERLELRHPEDILSEESLSSLSSLPITINHPTELVTAKNAEALSVGLTGDKASIDGQMIKTRVTVTHKRGIEAVETGYRELSLGYKTDLIEESGVYDGQPYTHRQTNVRYNHLALVPKARAGSMARINLDGAAVQSIDPPQEEEVIMTTELKTVAVNLDGLEYQAAPEVAKALEKAQSEIAGVRADAENTRADMQKELDSAQAKVDELKKQMDEYKEKRGDSAIADAAKARVALLSKASKVVNTDSLLDASDREIMAAVIAERHDGVDLSEKSDDYVQARFDAVIESIPSNEPVAKQREQSKRTDAEPVKRVDAMEIVRNQWKKEA